MPVGGELPVALLFAPQRRVAARGQRNQRGFAASVIVNRNIERNCLRRTQLADRGSLLLRDITGLQAQTFQRRPGQPRAPVVDRAKVRDVGPVGAEIERQIAQSGQDMLPPAGQRKGDVQPADQALAQQRGRRAAGPVIGGVVAQPGVSGLDREPDRPGGKIDRTTNQRDQAVDPVGIGGGLVKPGIGQAGKLSVKGQRSGGHGSDQRRRIGAAIDPAGSFGMGQVKRRGELPGAKKGVQPRPARQRGCGTAAKQGIGQRAQRTIARRGIGQQHRVQP